MNLLDRYLFKQFCKNLFLVMGALVGIYFLVDFFERIDNFLDADKEVSLAIKYFMLKVPFMIDLLQPVCILLAGVITLGLLNHNCELMALKAGGISIIRICGPLVAFAVFFSLVSLALAQWVLPPTLSETNRIWHEEVHNKIPKGTLRKGHTYYKGSQGIYTFVRSDPAKNLFTNFSYTKIKANYDLELFLTAEKAEWRTGKWYFLNGQLKKPVRGQKNRFTIELFREMQMHLPESPDLFFVPTYKQEEFSISQLFNKTTDERLERRAALVNFNSRLSFIFLGVPLIVMGLPILLLVHQKWGKDLTLAVPISCGLAFAAWGWWSTSQSMARAAYLHPVFASWSMHLIICGLGFWLLRNQE